MSIKFTCTCGKAYKVPEKFSGKRVKCKRCDEPIRVPSHSQAGVLSTRAERVSDRAVVSSDRSARQKSGRSVKSGRSDSSSKSAGSSAKVKKSKPGSTTEKVRAIDLTKGNKIKDYQRKKSKDEDFSKGTGRLTYFEEGKPKKAFRIGKKEAVLGRAEDCGISIPLSSLSREHMKIEYKLGTWIISDMQSTNGVVVNGRAVRRSSLKAGDIIQLGEAIFRLDC